MKKSGVLKRFSLTAITVLLCLAVMATCLTFAMPSSGAFADEPIVSTAVSLGDIELDQECEYGEQFTVTAPTGTTVTVTAPDGKTVEPTTEGKVTANQVGNYKVTYAKDGVSYDFYVRVKLAEDYFLKVAFNGAEIPSYVQVGDTFTLPDASVVYYDENDILQELKGCAFTVSDSDGKSDYNIKSENVAEKTFSAGSTAKRKFITYSATVGDGTKTLSKTFTVNVQSKVENSGNPTLTVSGVQRDVSVNRPVTLPKATATDSSDDNVKIVITVTKDGEPVKNVDIDEDGYAYRAEGNEYGAVEFDNDKSMTFYPTETGSYKVTYQAFNDANVKDSNAGKSSLREYYMTVSDLVAPVFKNVDEQSIPETWGKNVKGATDVDTSTLGGKITFTVPEIVDNNKSEDNELKIYFRITDADNSKTVVTFENVLDAAGDGNKFTPNATYGKVANTEASKAILFDKDHPFTFDFSEYNRGDDSGDNYGTYTVLFRARDKANNTSSKTYTVKFQENYTDSAAPTDAKVTVPDYLSSADKTLTIPYANVADASDTRLKKDYRVYTDAALGENDVRYIEVNGGEIADIEDGYLVINKGKANEKKLKLGSNLYFYVGATDDVGNRKTNAADNADITVEAADSEAYKTVEAKVAVLASNAKTYVYNNENNGTSDPITFANADSSKTTIEAGDTVIANGFSIKAGSYEMRNYTGYEVAVYDPNGNALNVTLETVNTKVTENEVDKDAIIYVQNIKFNAAVSTEAEEGEDAKYYTLVVRVFDVNGNSSVYGYKLENVAPSKNGNISTSAISTIGSSGTLNVTYKLNNEVIKGITGEPGVYYVARKIGGGVFSLMGSEFTAKTQGSYSVQDGYINSEKVTGIGSYTFNDDVNFAGANKGVYNFSITDNSAPVIEMQGNLQTYWAFPETGAKSVNVTLPTVVAYTETGMATIEVEVKDPDSYDVELVKDEDGNKTNEFIATKDGVYTVTYTATYKNAAPVTSTYNISVGDVVAPQFTLQADTGTSTTATLRVGDEFTFATMVLADGESSTGVTITKKLIDPSHEEVTEATVSGTYSGKREEKNNGTTITFNMAGTYEVVYTATDAVGNPSMQRVTITVVSSGSSTPTTWTTLSTVLIIVAVVLLAGVIIYVVRFRKVKK